MAVCGHPPKPKIFSPRILVRDGANKNRDGPPAFCNGIERQLENYRKVRCEEMTYPCCPWPNFLQFSRGKTSPTLPDLYSKPVYDNSCYCQPCYYGLSWFGQNVCSCPDSIDLGGQRRVEFGYGRPVFSRAEYGFSVCSELQRDISSSNPVPIVHIDNKNALFGDTSGEATSDEGTGKQPRSRKVTQRQRSRRAKTYQCPYCEVCCSNQGQLKGHVRIHTGERPYRCPEKGCSKAFIRNEELTRHRRIHTGERPHRCGACGKAFSRKDHLNKHIKVHTYETDFINN